MDFNSSLNPSYYQYGGDGQADASVTSRSLPPTDASCASVTNSTSTTMNSTLMYSIKQEETADEFEEGSGFVGLPTEPSFFKLEPKAHVTTLEDMPIDLQKPAERIFSQSKEPAFSDLLFMKLHQVQQQGGCSEDIAIKLVKYASKQLVSIEPRLVSQMPKLRKLSLGCPLIDQLLGGGISESGGIVEVVGEAGSGKSQFLMQAMLQAQLPVSCGGLNGRTLLITTEAWSKKRWQQLSIHYHQLYPYVFRDPYSTYDMVTHIKDCITLDSLLEFVSTKLHQIMHEQASQSTQTPIKLIVIDSIAALTRGQENEMESIASFSENYKGVQAMEQTAKLFRLAMELKALSDIYQVVFLIANQVSDYSKDMDRFSYARAAESFETSGRRVMPALGLSWSQCVNTRIQLRRSDRQVAISNYVDSRTLPSVKRRKVDEQTYTTDSQPKMTVLRFMTVALGSSIQHDTLPFWIDGVGLHGIDNNSLAT